MASSTRDRPASTSSSSLPPRVLNVQKFAESRSAELEALHAIISSRNEGNFHLQRCKRRRTSSHDARIARNKHSRKRAKLEKKEDSNEKDDKEKKMSRRIRRRRMFRKNMEFGFSVSGDGTERLRTHLWHAKRFTMVKRWGFYLPLGVHGRGQGSRALLKRLKSGALLHDSSYSTAIQLAGREDSVLAILRMVLVQPQLDFSEMNSQLVLHGMCHQNAMLHHIGAPLSRLVCPVTYMWRPVKSNALHGKSCMNDVSSSSRQLWIWVHGAAFNEAFSVLSDASREQACRDGAPVNCLSLKGKLGKLELIGSEATQILRKILHSSSELSNPSKNSLSSSSTYLVPCNSFHKETVLSKNLEQFSRSTSKLSMIFEEAEKIPSCAVISLDVIDPRDLSFRRTNSEDIKIQSDLPKEKSLKEPSTALLESPELNGENELSLWSGPSWNAEFVSDCKELWESHDKLKPPIDDSALCLEKHHKRLKEFYMDDIKPAALGSESQDCGSRRCPVLLLKHSFQNNALKGWSIILPLSWVKSFWVPLVSCGARAIGLREKRWVASDSRIPCFPFDFPDCNAYVTLMDDVASEFDQMADLCPPAMRPTRVPIPPPWDCIKSSISKLPEVIQENDQIGDENLPHLTSRFDSFMKACSSTAQSTDPLFFLGSVIRSEDVLHQCLNHINGAHLLLFPSCGMDKKALSCLIERERMSWVPRSVKKLSADRSLLFSRVLLRPCQEGAFEEGAVVCAPFFSDVLSMLCSSEEREKLQISQSTVDSYFLQVDSGRWIMQVPHDPSHRWPIGFVTSGSTRGSAHLTAMAVCEVTLLAHLREQQWSQMLQKKSKPEVFVLVRNLRSTAYRLCCASIFLEQGHDFDSM